MAVTREHSDWKLFFIDKISFYKQQCQQVTQALQRVAYARLLVLLLGIAGVVYFANQKAFGPTALAAGVVVLVLIVLQLKHNRLTERQARVVLRIAVNEDEVARSDLDARALDNGSAYADYTHPYGQDLDIVGQYSLFGLLNRTTTTIGGRKLAAWLLGPADRDTIARRQQAVRELAGKPEWRQDFEVEGRYQRGSAAKEGMLSSVRLDQYLGPLARKRKRPVDDQANAFEDSLQWLGEENRQLKKYKALYLLALVVLPATFIVLVHLFLSALIANIGQPAQTQPLLWLLLMWGVVSVDKQVLRTLRPDILPLRKFAPQAVPMLNGIKALMAVTEKENFRTDLLAALRSQCRTDVAGAQLDKLISLLDHFSRNPTTKDVVLLTDLYWLFRGESLKRKITPEQLTTWAETISELEALNSLAGFAYIHPTYTFPRITDEPYCFRARDLGHPLIDPAKRVTNDFALDGRGTVVLVTGSNMAGKSTFLRTVGINTALALAGAPVCAAALEVSVMRVFTSMRTADDLAESTSSFMAELRRIHQLVQLLKTDGLPVLFLLDEILKGTNSADRHTGAKALARQLSKAGAFGLISTHDLELVSLSEEMNLANYSFNSRIEGDQIWFDYRLTDGPCRAANATALMRQLGIGV